jgi:hypothetical protein
MRRSARRGHGATVVLWALATVRHAFTDVGRARIDDREPHRIAEREPAGHRS